MTTTTETELELMDYRAAAEAARRVVAEKWALQQLLAVLNDLAGKQLAANEVFLRLEKLQADEAAAAARADRANADADAAVAAAQRRAEEQIKKINDDVTQAQAAANSAESKRDLALMELRIAEKQLQDIRDAVAAVKV